MKKILLYIAVFLLIFAAIFYGLNYRKKISKNSSGTSSPKVSETILPEPKDTPQVIKQEEAKLPEEYDLKVPFVSQAPFANWDELHDNACEEESIILVHYYKKGLTITPEEADQQILKMVDFEIKKYGEHKNLTTEETSDVAKEFYGYKNIKIKYDFTWDELKKEIVKGNPVIVPAAGRLLKNPNFRGAGPAYHMFIIRGYTQKELITDEVGTRKGDGYRYSYGTLDKAIHDWTGDENTIESGKRVMMVIEN